MGDRLTELTLLKFAKDLKDNGANIKPGVTITSLKSLEYKKDDSNISAVKVDKETGAEVTQLSAARARKSPLKGGSS